MKKYIHLTFLLLFITVNAFAQANYVSLGSTFYYDDNKNGVQDGTEKGIPNFSFFLLKKEDDGTTNSIINNDGFPFFNTDDKGNFFIDSLQEGNYFIEFQPIPDQAFDNSKNNYNCLCFTNSLNAGDNQIDGNNDAISMIIENELNKDNRVYTPLFNLKISQETTNEPFQGGEQHNTFDTNGDMTMDIGLYYGNISLSNFPVNLKYFKGSQENNTTNLVWEVANEVNFDYYEVQQMQENNEFLALAKIKANNSPKYNYEIKNDILPSFYRLKMVDLDGSFSYSNIVSIVKENPDAFIIAENPVKNGKIELKTNLKDPKFLLINNSGLSIVPNHLKLSESNYKINAEKVNSGIFYLQIDSEGKKYVRRLLK